MSRKTDDLPMTKELGLRLRSLRRRASLTQAELAGLAGGSLDQALVSRLESGLHSNPTLSLVAHYLRACRASFSEIADLLDTYTARPLLLEQEGREAVARVTEALPVQIGNQALHYDIKTTVARRAERKPPLSSEERVKRVVNLAAAASRRKRLDILVKYLEDEVGHRLAATERQYLHLLARKFWGALSSTRGGLKHVRLTRMARVVGEGVAAHVLSERDVRLVRDRVVELFSRMETTGAFGAEPQPASPRRKPSWLERQKRMMTPEMLKRQAYIGEGLNSVMSVTEMINRPASERVSWYNWLTLLASAAYDTLPGTPEREQVLEEALKDRPDQDLARKFAELALSGLDRQLHRA
ncbi:MAG TPA: helix-turn-helix domain-containing protein [bacterium]|nr:helix-turn-helix domain-containing protein [bacterium]